MQVYNRRETIIGGFGHHPQTRNILRVNSYGEVISCFPFYPTAWTPTAASIFKQAGTKRQTYLARGTCVIELLHRGKGRV